MGRKTAYVTEPLSSSSNSSSSNHRVITDPSDLKIDKTVDSLRGIKMTAPDGTVTQTSKYSDPRFGSQSPYTGNASVKTPSGLTYSGSSSRSVSLKESGNPLSLTSMTQSTTVNSRTSTSTYDAATHKITDKSPAGRLSIATVDDRGRVVLEEAGGLAPTSYAYDDRGRLTEAKTGTGDSTRTTTYTYARTYNSFGELAGYKANYLPNYNTPKSGSPPPTCATT